jgi:hypothetical protein
MPPLFQLFGACHPPASPSTTLLLISDGKFPEIFTGGNFPEIFPTMFAHRFLVAYFLTVLSMLP